ncbi:MAG TPA: hypothetical protein VGD37_16125, partial [Kofleriaceae bacterium]
MRSALILIATIAGCTGTVPDAGAAPPETGRRHVSLGSDALDAARSVAARHGAPLEILETGAGVAVVELDAADLGRLAEEIHARHDRCGGFMVHDTLADAHAAVTAAAAFAA